MNRPVALAAIGLAGVLSTTARADDCPRVGRILDADGIPVAGVVVRAGDESAVTDDAGRYEVPGTATPIEITLRHRAGDAIAFEIVRDDRLLTWARSDGCGGDFSPHAPTGFSSSSLDADEYDDALALFAGLVRGFAMMKELSIAPQGKPLRVEAWQVAANPNSSYWVGSPSYHPTPPRDPLLGLGASASLRDDPGRPDNREYHELGHHALALGLGASPHARADTSHGGYYANPTSADAWTEGFATFFATRVADRIEGRTDANLYAMAGTRIDLELDYRPWELGGLEEFAVAGLLLDLVDGPRPRSTQGLPEIGSAYVVEGDHGAAVVVELGQPPTPRPAQVGRLALTAGDAAVWSIDVDPTAWADPWPGRLAIGLPTDVDAREVDGAHWVAGERADDDPFTVETPELWRTIAAFESTQPESNGHLFDVADLHVALRARFGGKDANGDGLDDVDGLFVAHGLYADLDGDHAHDDGETIGRTGHPARTVEIGGTPKTFEAAPARRRVPLPRGLVADVSAPDTVARWWVTTIAAGAPPRLTRPRVDEAGQVAIVPPPEDDAAAVVVTADADEHVAAVVARWTAAELHESALVHTAPALAVAASLRPGEPSHADAPVDPRVLFYAGASAACLGLVLLVVGGIRARG